jgi:peroxiredoxin
MRIQRLSFYLAMTTLLLVGLTAAAGRQPTKANIEQSSPGNTATDFRLDDLEGNSRTLGQYTRAGNVVVLEWVDPTCPYVERYHGKDNFVAESMDDFSGEAVTWLAIDSGNTPVDELRTFHRAYEVPMPILQDTTGHVQRAFGVMATPTVVVIGANREIVYRGALDSSSINDERTGGENYLKAAINAALKSRPAEVQETVAEGCPT